MGSGSWTSKDWNSYSKRTISGRSTAQIYSSTNVKSEFDPKNIKMRESCDGSDHPAQVCQLWRNERLRENQIRRRRHE